MQGVAPLTSMYLAHLHVIQYCMSEFSLQILNTFDSQEDFSYVLIH